MACSIFLNSSSSRCAASASLLLASFRSWVEAAFCCGTESLLSTMFWSSETVLPSIGPLPPLRIGDWPLPNAEDRLDFSSANLVVFTCEMA